MKRALEYLAGILLFFMFLTTFFQVLARAVFQISAAWTDELARLSFVCMVFLCTAVLIRDDGLIRVTSLTGRIGKRPAAVLRIITDLAILPLLVIITWGAWTNTRLNWDSFAPTMDWLRMGYVYLVIVIAGLAMLWYQVANIIEQVRKSFVRTMQGQEGAQ
jgi:TRAP-type C4-dicarboxylate transport system permease small subunit